MMKGREFDIAVSLARFLFPLNEASDREMRISETGEDRAGRVNKVMRGPL